MKYKVGDKVIIRSDLIENRLYGNIIFVSYMSKFKGEQIIKEVRKNENGYTILADTRNFIWTDEMFEDIKEDKMDNNTFQINMNNLTDEERTTLLSLVKKANKPVNKVWKPEIGESYYTLSNEGLIIKVHYNGFFSDENRCLIGNYFKTQQEAEFALERQKVITELKRYALEHNEKEIDWNTGKKNLYIYYSYRIKRIDIDCTITMKENTVYFTSTEIAEAAIKAIGEDRLKKYYFEVND